MPLDFLLWEQFLLPLHPAKLLLVAGLDLGKKGPPPVILKPTENTPEPRSPLAAVPAADIR
jgi:hypothetical protein